MSETDLDEMTETELESLKVEVADELLRVVWPKLYKKLGALVPATADEAEMLFELREALTRARLDWDAYGSALVDDLQKVVALSKDAKRAARRTNRQHRVTNANRVSD
jgi:hypothetical protein